MFIYRGIKIGIYFNIMTYNCTIFYVVHRNSYNCTAIVLVSEELSEERYHDISRIYVRTYRDDNFFSMNKLIVTHNGLKCTGLVQPHMYVRINLDNFYKYLLTT